MKADIRKIMVPVDFSATCEHALDHAAWLAATSKSELLLVHVLSPYPLYFEPSDAVPNELDETRNFAEEKLRDLARRCSEKYGVNPKYRILQGRISLELVDLALAESIGLIMMGTHGAKGLEEILIGSNAQHLVTRAPCPVITFKEEKRKPGFSNIVLPIERSRHSREKVSMAIHLAVLCNAKIHVLGLVGSKDDGEYEKLQIVLDHVQMAIDRSQVSYSRHTVRGDNLAHEAMKYAEQINADLIMILSEDESVMGRIDLGRLSRHIVNHSPIPVLSMHAQYGTFEATDVTGVASAY